MAGGEIELRWVYPPAERNEDPRTVELVKNNGADDAFTLYKVSSIRGPVHICLIFNSSSFIQSLAQE